MNKIWVYVITFEDLGMVFEMRIVIRLQMTIVVGLECRIHLLATPQICDLVQTNVKLSDSGKKKIHQRSFDSLSTSQFCRWPVKLASKSKGMSGKYRTIKLGFTEPEKMINMSL